MSKLTLYHNPNCSKSRGALDILRQRNIDCEVIEYLKSPPTAATLARALDLLPTAPAELVRNDKRFKELGLDSTAYQSPDAVIELLQQYPELMQRPLAIRGERAIIARPSELITELLD